MNPYTPEEGSAGQLTLALVKDLQRKLADKNAQIRDLQRTLASKGDEAKHLEELKCQLEEQLRGMWMSLIRTTDSRGNRVLITSTAVATVTEADASSQYHGTRSIIRLLDGRVIESMDGCRTIEEQMTTGGEGWANITT